MNDERFKKTLENAFPETPDVFHARMEQIARQTRQQVSQSRRHRLARAALVFALTLALAGAGVAAMTHYGVLNFNPGWEDDYYFALPEAKDMIQYDLAETQTGNILWKVKEAIYDGRVLRVLYSATDLTETQPFPTLEPGYELDFAERYYNAMAQREGVFLKADGNGEIIVNGVGVNLQSVDKRPGDTPGEIEIWIDCRMEYYDQALGEYVTIQPEGALSLSLPFSFKNDEIAAASPDSLAFRMQAGDAASRYALQLPAPLTLESGSALVFSDLHFSPATVFMDFTITVPAENVPEMPDIADDMEGYFAALGKMEEYQNLWNAYLENSRGERLGVSRDASSGEKLNADGSLTFLCHWEFSPSDRYTDTIFLCLGSWKIPIPMVYQNQE